MRAELTNKIPQNIVLTGNKYPSTLLQAFYKYTAFATPPFTQTISQAHPTLDHVPIQKLPNPTSNITLPHFAPLTQWLRHISIASSLYNQIYI
jgi:hypothetical protein